MAEKTFPLQVVGVEYECDECESGTMQPYGTVAWLTEPLQYPHRCSTCGATRGLPEKYPTVRHLRILPVDDIPVDEW
jgi:DNA-directed RNA polymerase subunit RPC12/RpoP